MLGAKLPIVDTCCVIVYVVLIVITHDEQAGSSDVESVSDYYSGELVSYVRKV